MHVPVMLRECLEYLAVRPDGVYLDATAGMGGHAGAIARQLTTGLVLACDRDAESLERARENTADAASRIRFHKFPFSLVGEALAAEHISQLDGLLADLGVSRYQLTEGERGFSLMADGPLDMRMDRSQERTAADIVNYESEKELADLIFKLGEERRSRKIARAIVRARPISTTGQLAKLIESAAPRTGNLHGAADRSQSGNRGTRRSAGVFSEIGETRRACGLSDFHVARGPQGQTEFSSAGERRASQNSDTPRRASQRSRSPGESTVAVGETARFGNDITVRHQGKLRLWQL
jgi:hypothetical protein